MATNSNVCFLFRPDDDWSIQSKCCRKFSDLKFPTKNLLSKVYSKPFREWDETRYCFSLLNGAVEFTVRETWSSTDTPPRQSKGAHSPAAEVGGGSSKRDSVSCTKGCGNCIAVEKSDWSCLQLCNVDMLHHSRGYVTQGLRIPASHSWQHREDTTSMNNDDLNLCARNHIH